MSAELEAVYRRTLRWYPKRWRATNEDAMIGTLMEQADHEGRTHPSRGELANLRTNALLDRGGAIGHAVPRDVRTRAATIALSLAFTIASAGLVLNVWQLRRWAGATVGFTQAGPLFNVGMVYYGTWVVALVVALFGLRRISFALVVATLPIAIVLASVPAFRVFGTPGSVTVGFLELLGVLYALGPPAITRRIRAEFAIITGGFLVLFALVYWIQTFGYWGNGALGVDYFWAAFAIWLTLLGLPAVVIASLIVWRSRRSRWAPAMLLAAVPILLLSLVEFGNRTNWMVNLGFALAVIVAVAAALALLRLFGIRLRLTRT